MTRERMALILPALCAAAVFFANIGGYDLWPPDEPRFGQVAREMLRSGDAVHLTVNGRTYREKPPLLFWAIALVSVPVGDVTSATARIPSAFAGVVTVVITFLLAKRLFNARAAAMSALVLMTCTLFLWEARTARTDMLLAGCMTAALYAFWRHHEAPAIQWRIVFFLATAAGLYAKGPPALAFAVLLIAAFYWGRGEQRRKLRAGWGLLFAVVAIGLWAVPAYLAGPGQRGTGPSLSLGENLYRQVIGRFVLGVSKAQPPWYYFENLPLNLFPWTLFVPWTLYWVWKNRRAGDPMRLLLSWSLPAFVFFSISAGKRAVYLLPLYPAFAILIGASLIDLIDSDRARWRRRTGYVWALILFLAGLPLLPLVYLEFFDTVLYPDIDAEISDFTMSNVSIGGAGIFSMMAFFACALALSVHALVVCFRRGARGVPFAMGAHYTGLAIAASLLVYPIVNVFKGAGDFCAPLRQLAQEGVEFRLYSVAFSREEYIFYADHFHTPFLVDEWPLPAPEGADPYEVAAQQRQFGGALRKAVAGVPVQSLKSPTDSDLDELRKTAGGMLKLAEAKYPLVKPFAEALTEALAAFDEEFRTGGPAYCFVQAQDWRWLLAFHPQFRELRVLDERRIGSDHVLLVANEAGAKQLRG